MNNIEGFDEEISEELRARAKDALLTQAIASEEELDAHEPAEDLAHDGGYGSTLGFLLASRGSSRWKTSLSRASTTYVDIEDMTAERAAELIMTARAPWFADEEEATPDRMLG